MKRRHLLMSVTASVLLAIGVLARRGRPTVVADSGAISLRVVARAVVEPRDGIAHVLAPHVARVTRLSAEEGQRVEAGAELAGLEDWNSVASEPLTAPIAGVVVARNMRLGEDVGPGSGPLFEMSIRRISACASRSRAAMREGSQSERASACEPQGAASRSQRPGFFESPRAWSHGAPQATTHALNRAFASAMLTCNRTTRSSSDAS